MSLSDALLPEFDQEMAITRRVLDRVPEDRLSWTPHPKSMPLGNLANHLAAIPTKAVDTIDNSSFDVAPGGAPRPRVAPATSRQEILDSFDKNVAAARAAIAGATDEQLLQPWSLLAGGRTLFTLPRIACLRRLVLSHSIHHRAQLGVYLRLNDIPVPGIYGPSADEAI